MKRIGIFLDNGVTGSIAIMDKDLSICEFFQTPIKKEQSYTKAKQSISRIDHVKLKKMLNPYKENAIAVCERPLVNPGRWKASVSALRALESTLVILEQLVIAVQYIDSREWQRVLLPQGIKGSAELKKASTDIGNRLFPQHKAMIKKQKDADALLIGEYWRRNKL